ncbi:hypothetical protein Y032_0067g35 [Ancylostoma ceylanicum]|uniref:Uncharacterized protein n=1 Tax=Ancylostoma ceylanicum TaxID=53326 RepID=A0A016U0N6_9BILA|nr:hypothetical protein Y032_0067g35 [Ancylostoma ceylanicum]
MTRGGSLGDPRTAQDVTRLGQKQSVSYYNDANIQRRKNMEIVRVRVTMGQNGAMYSRPSASTSPAYIHICTGRYDEIAHELLQVGPEGQGEGLTKPIADTLPTHF